MCRDVSAAADAADAYREAFAITAVITPTNSETLHCWRPCGPWRMRLDDSTDQEGGEDADKNPPRQGKKVDNVEHKDDRKGKDYGEKELIRPGRQKLLLR